MTGKLRACLRLAARITCLYQVGSYAYESVYISLKAPGGISDKIALTMWFKPGVVMLDHTEGALN
jgi:hypothetical protein